MHTQYNLALSFTHLNLDCFISAHFWLELLMKTFFRLALWSETNFTCFWALCFLTGIISSISFSPHNGMLAVGSYSQTTVVYAESNIGAFVYLAWPAWLEKQITWIADNMMKIPGAFSERRELSIYRRAQGYCLRNNWLVGHTICHFRLHT